MLLDPAALSASPVLPSSALPSVRAATAPPARRRTGGLARLTAVLRATHQARIPF